MNQPFHIPRRLWAPAVLCCGLLVLLLAANCDARLWELAWNTTQLATLTSLFSLPTGTLLAVLLFRTDLPWRRTWLVMLCSFLFMPLYLQCAGWQAGFGQQGWYMLASGSLGVPALLSGWRGAVWVHSLAAVPWVTLIVGVGLRRVEADLEAAAALDGTSWHVLWHVTLPRGMTGIGVAALWIAVTTAAEMTVTDLFQIRTFAEDIYTGFYLGEGISGALPGTVAGIAFAVATVAIMTILAWWLCLQLVPRPGPVAWQSRRRFALGRWRWLAVAGTGAGLCLMTGVPIANLIYKAGVIVRMSGDDRVRSWSLSKCATIIAQSPWQHGDVYAWSLLTAGVSATCVLVVAIPLGWAAARRRVLAITSLMIVAICLALPGPVIGQLIIAALNQRESALLTWLYDQTLLAPCLAQGIRALPLATLVCWHAFRSLPEAMLDAAQMDGAGILSCLLTVVLPNRLAALGLAWLVALTIALGDLAASVLVVPPGVDLLSIYIFDLLHTGVEDYVAGIVLTNLAMFLLIAVPITIVVIRRRGVGE